MPKLGSFSGDEIVIIMQKHGFLPVRQKGSHMIMQKRTDDGSTITVPVPMHKVVKIGTLQSIIRQSGIPKDAF